MILNNNNFLPPVENDFVMIDNQAQEENDVPEIVEEIPFVKIDPRDSKENEQSSSLFLSLLSDEIRVGIYHYLDLKSIGRLAQVCLKLNMEMKDEALWKYLLKRDLGSVLFQGSSQIYKKRLALQKVISSKKFESGYSSYSETIKRAAMQKLWRKRHFCWDLKGTGFVWGSKIYWSNDKAKGVKVLSSPDIFAVNNPNKPLRLPSDLFFKSISSRSPYFILTDYHFVSLWNKNEKKCLFALSEYHCANILVDDKEGLIIFRNCNTQSIEVWDWWTKKKSIIDVTGKFHYHANCGQLVIVDFSNTIHVVDLKTFEKRKLEFTEPLFSNKSHLKVISRDLVIIQDIEGDKVHLVNLNDSSVTTGAYLGYQMPFESNHFGYPGK
jgi:hypothetical protein